MMADVRDEWRAQAMADPGTRRLHRVLRAMFRAFGLTATFDEAWHEVTGYAPHEMAQRKRDALRKIDALKKRDER